LTSFPLLMPFWIMQSRISVTYPSCCSFSSFLMLFLFQCPSISSCFSFNVPPFHALFFFNCPSISCCFSLTVPPFHAVSLSLPLHFISMSLHFMLFLFHCFSI
jgi:hypothetical protein